jgi:phenylalanine-4-hydroxylase
MQSQQNVIDSLPAHIQPFVALQDYSQYTPRDHAVWRFLLHQLSFSLKDKAHTTYFDGLAKTGINKEAIPKIEEINHRLNKLGWRAVAVDGFLPPAIFMEFQAIKVLAIAINIRSFEHMLYTPAPDIIHESAGHAPFLIDIDYAEFLQRFGELGMRAIANQHDLNIFEAVRHLSIVKESSVSSAQEKLDAQKEVEQLQDKKVTPSEANLLARLHWWTVEYGLVGELDDFRIYGAGLLSSLSESQCCFDRIIDGEVVNSDVLAKLLTIDSVNFAYDITMQQPQLFVTKSCRHLSHILAEYSRKMACNIGGYSAMTAALEAKSVVTCTLNSELQVSGKLSKVHCDAVQNIIYFNTEGPTQLSLDNTQLLGHGIEHHAQGFGSPLGHLIGMERCLSLYSIDELHNHGITINQQICLQFLSGITVTGHLDTIVRRKQCNILFSFSNCTVKDINGTLLFDPDWGVFDMAVGESIISVSGGAADQVHFPQYLKPESATTIQTNYDESTQIQFDLYEKVRDCRESQDHEIHALVIDIVETPDNDWLLLFEALELLQLTNSNNDELKQRLYQALILLKQESSETAALIVQGLERL